MADEQHLPGDTVTGTDPLVFSLEFVSRMRKRKGLSHVPSLRTAIAIPRYLTARAFRKGALIPQDYLEVYCLAGNELEARGFDDVFVRLIVHLRLFGVALTCRSSVQVQVPSG